MAIEIDPVCGMEVDTTTSTLSAEHDGTTYWFCAKGCLLDFQDDPHAFLPADHIHRAGATTPPGSAG
jgi:YHS domain-containing protein